jgi:hypothetical protein
MLTHVHIESVKIRYYYKNDKFYFIKNILRNY